MLPFHLGADYAFALMKRTQFSNSFDQLPGAGSTLQGACRLKAVIALFVSVLLVPAFAYAERDGDGSNNYSGAAFSAPFDFQYVSALDPPYLEAVDSVSPGAVHRYYPDEGAGVAVELSYMHPWARVVRVDGRSATSVRDDHVSWAGVRSSVAVTDRWFLDSPGSEESSLFFHLDGGMQFLYYYREAENQLGESSFESSRIGLSVTARPGLVLGLRNSFFLGVDVLFGASLVNRETVDRRPYLEDLEYNSFFRGVFVAPGLSAGVSY